MCTCPQTTVKLFIFPALKPHLMVSEISSAHYPDITQYSSCNITSRKSTVCDAWVTADYNALFLSVYMRSVWIVLTKHTKGSMQKLCKCNLALLYILWLSWLDISVSSLYLKDFIQKCYHEKFIIENFISLSETQAKAKTRRYQTEEYLREQALLLMGWNSVTRPSVGGGSLIIL